MNSIVKTYINIWLGNKNINYIEFESIKYVQNYTTINLKGEKIVQSIINLVCRSL